MQKIAAMSNALRDIWICCGFHVVGPDTKCPLNVYEYDTDFLIQHAKSLQHS